jgi:hypothetical protein
MQLFQLIRIGGESDVGPRLKVYGDPPLKADYSLNQGT